MRGFFARHRFILSFVFLNSMMGMSVGLGKVAAPLYALSLGANESVLGVVAGAQSAGILLISLPMGLFVERYGPYGLFVFGSLLATALYMLLPTVASLGFLVACTFAISFCMPFRFVPLNTVFLQQLANLGDEKAGFARGSHMAGTALLGPVLAATAIEGFGFRGTYWLIAALFLITATMASLVFGRSAPAPRPGTALSFDALRAQLRILSIDAEVRSASMVDFTAQAMMGFYTFFIVVIAVADLGLGTEQASGLVGAQGLSYVLALFMLGRLVGRLGQLATYLLSAAVIATALLLLGTADDAAGLWGGGLALGLGLGILQIVNLMRFARIGARLGQGRIAGLNALVGPAGSLFGSFGGGLIGHRLGLQTVFLLFLPALVLVTQKLHAGHKALAEA
ncbi:MAG: MFS transporter [Polyangiales bacterium]